MKSRDEESLKSHQNPQVCWTETKDKRVNKTATPYETPTMMTLPRRISIRGWEFKRNFKGFANKNKWPQTGRMGCRALHCRTNKSLFYIPFQRKNLVQSNRRKKA